MSYLLDTLLEVNTILYLAFIYFYTTPIYVSGVWGVTEIREGLEKRNTANYDSYSVQYYDMDDLYFKEYSYVISVVISGPNLDFSNVNTQNQIETITKAFEDSKYIDRCIDCWLRDFLDYVERNKDYKDLELPIDTQENFAKTLREVYLADESNPYRLDVHFSDDGTKIKAARFLIQVRRLLF